MPDQVDRAVIKPEVLEVIAAVTRNPVSSIKETQLLWGDLGMTSLLKKAMAIPYSAISQKRGGLVVTQTAADKCKTVKDSIDLVHKRANRQS